MGLLSQLLYRIHLHSYIDVQVIFAKRHVIHNNTHNRLIGYYDHCDSSILNNSKLVTLPFA
jgi:hypothetical protein